MRRNPSTWQQVANRMEFGVSAERPIDLIAGEPVRPSAATLYDVHFELEVGVVTQGRARRLYPEGYHRDFGFGEIWFHGMWEPHGWTVLEPDTRMIIAMVWPPFMIDLNFQEAPALRWMAPFVVKPHFRPVVPPPLRSETVRIACALAAIDGPARGLRDDAPCMKAAASTEGRPPVDTERGRLLSRLLLLQLLTLVLTDPANRHLRTAAAPITSQHLSPALMLVFSSRKHLSVKEAATACGMSERFFSESFVEAMGVTFGQFALRRRLSCAANELMSTDHQVKRVALDWGFSDESHFCRSFEHIYRCTPSGYRQAKREE